MGLDFAMSRYEHEDIVLRAIGDEALNFLSNHVDTSRIKCILLTGSVANAEGTVVQYNGHMVASDFDFVIYMGFVDFMRHRKYLTELSQQITARFVTRGINTHITFVPFTGVFQAPLFFAKSGIYEYEFAFASRCLFGRMPQLTKDARPTKMDALELTFTVVSDIVFSNIKSLSKIEESYIYAKRALTLLNSILIFHGLFAETYQERIGIAKRYSETQAIPITNDEIKMLEIFTRYKLSGYFPQLINSLGCSNIDEAVQLQKGFLIRMVIKTLYYELESFLCKARMTLECNSSIEEMMSKLPTLLKEHYRRSRIRALPRAFGIILYVGRSLGRDKRQKELFATFVFHGKSPKSILNVLAAISLIHGDEVFLGNALKQVFPWVKFDEKINPVQRMFSLWQIAEQSIKL
jgi:hypothetical protein